MSDLTKKKRIGEYDTEQVTDTTDAIAYDPQAAVGERTRRVNLRGAIQHYAGGAFAPEGSLAEIEAGTETEARTYAPATLNSAIDQLISDAALPSGTEAQIVAGTDTTERVFTPADINGAVGTLTANRSGFVTPEMYGAAGDGVTDDTAALQAAVDTGLMVSGVNGSVYAISGSVGATDAGDVGFIGGGSKIVILDSDTSDHSVFRYARCTSVTIEDCIIDGGKSSRVVTNPNFSHGISVSLSSSVSIKNNRVAGTFNSGILAYKVKTATVTGNHVTSTGGANIFVKHGENSYDPQFSYGDVVISNNVCDGSEISNNIFLSLENAPVAPVTSGGVHNATITGNVCVMAGDVGIEVGHYAADGEQQWNRNVTISGNSVGYSAKSGILCRNCITYSVTGNTVKSPGYLQTSLGNLFGGISVRGDDRFSKNGLISSNVIDMSNGAEVPNGNGTAYPIRFSGAERLRIQGNQIHMANGLQNPGIYGDVVPGFTDWNGVSGATARINKDITIINNEIYGGGIVSDVAHFSGLGAGDHIVKDNLVKVFSKPQYGVYLGYQNVGGVQTGSRVVKGNEIHGAKAAFLNLTITGITNANPAVVSYTGTAPVKDIPVYISGVVGMTQVNNRMFSIQNVTGSTFELVGTDSTGYSTYAGGGFVEADKHYSIFVDRNCENVVIDDNDIIDSNGVAVDGGMINGVMVASVSNNRFDVDDSQYYPRLCEVQLPERSTDSVSYDFGSVAGSDSGVAYLPIPEVVNSRAATLEVEYTTRASNGTGSLVRESLLVVVSGSGVQTVTAGGKSSIVESAPAASNFTTSYQIVTSQYGGSDNTNMILVEINNGNSSISLTTTVTCRVVGWSRAV